MTEEMRRILRAVDHTLLTQTAVWERIKAVCEEGIQYQTASVCVPPSFVEEIRNYFGSEPNICTVIGFPNGYATTKTKCFEAEDALQNGADEIDMVINLGMVKEKNWDAVAKEIQSVKKVCGRKILKVIVEANFLTEPEKIELCRIVSDSGADYMKTSTGFSGGGATREDVALFLNHLAPHVKVKASGGIRTLEDASDFLRLGASRLGCSGLVALFRNS